MKKIAIIPARGGSKGLPNKNVKILDGKPLIAYAIEAAKNTALFDKVIVSTDSEEIARISLEYCAEVPFVRPEELSGDSISSDDVVNHALLFFEKQGNFYNYVCKLQPTSPLRNKCHIEEAYTKMIEAKVESVVSVCECEHSPLWSGVLDDSLSMQDFIQDKFKTAVRQGFPKYYRLNGAIYWSEVKAFKRNQNFIGESSMAYIMQKEDSVDIDDILDFKFAEFLIQQRRGTTR